MNKPYYSQRVGSHPYPDGLPLGNIIDLFMRVYAQFEADGYFTQAFGYECTDSGFVSGEVKDVGLEILLDVRKNNLWPIKERAGGYSEDDLFDVIEFLHSFVSKPIEGFKHDWNDCGMHWTSFNKVEGQKEYRDRVNKLLDHYKRKFELSIKGEVLRKPESGFERIFMADVPTSDPKVSDKVDAAILKYLRHGSTFDDRRQSVRDLVDVLEYLRPKVKHLLTSNDEKDLFNIANNFGIRHHNDHQKTSYDAQVWLPWMFYVYLSTIHVILRKTDKP